MPKDNEPCKRGHTAWETDARGHRFCKICRSLPRQRRGQAGGLKPKLATPHRESRLELLERERDRDRLRAKNGLPPLPSLIPVVRASADDAAEPEPVEDTGGGDLVEQPKPKRARKPADTHVDVKVEAGIFVALDADQIERVDNQVARLQRLMPGLEPSRADAIRTALLKGLEIFEGAERDAQAAAQPKNHMPPSIQKTVETIAAEARAQGVA